MDPKISLGQKNTLVEYMILSGADNRPPMLDKDLYDSWKSQMELYMQNREHGRMTLESVEHGPLIWPTVEKNGLPADIYLLVNHHRVAKDLWERVQLLMQGTSLTKQERECFVVPVFFPGDDPIACLNKAMAFLTAVASSRFPSTNNQLRTSSNLRNQVTIQDGRVTMQQVQGRQGQNYSGTTYIGNATSSRGNITSGQAKVVKCYNCQGEGHILDEEQITFLEDPGIPADQAQTIIPRNAVFQTEDLDTYDSDCDDLSTVQAVLMANISNYGSDIISEDFEQTPVMDFTDNEISSNSNIIPYSQYFQETQQATVQDTNLQAQQDSMILSVIEQMSEQMINHVNNWEKANKEQKNESITAELERYKERVKIFEQRLNIDLSTRKKCLI
ncbi:hypothetical protein Tco_0217599 [Tanacetum coccineum]